jgi:SAM-dependent methyltransferase
MKSAMSGQKIPLLHRFFSAMNLFHAYKAGTFTNAEKAIQLHRQLTDILKAYVKINVTKAKILDVGCGQTVTQMALFTVDGAEVTGIDIEVPTYTMNLKKFVQVIKINGVERAVKSLLRHLFFDGRFFKELSLHYGKTVSFDHLDIRLMSAADLSFPDNCFDFIYSAWAFEHIDNVPAAVQEVNRVLKPTGIAWIGVHLFPSLSGGHHLDWIWPDENPSDKVPPWDHLLDNRYPVNTYLNKLRLGQYREIFHKHMAVLDCGVTYEGEQFLTSELEETLQHQGYTREDLLTRTATFLCRKKRGGKHTRQTTARGSA